MDEFFNGYTLGIEVIKHEKQSYTDGSEGNTIYYKILNQTSKKIKIEISEVYKINGNNAQFDKDWWLTGYTINDTSIMSGAFKTAGAIFSNAVSGGINQNNKTGIVIKDLTNGFEYESIFILGENNKWSLLSCDVKEQEKVPAIRTIESKLKKSIERLEVFEEKLGIRLDNISIKTDSEFNKLTIFGEVFSVAGEALAQDINIKINLYNGDNDIIGTQSSYFSQEDFMGYDAFEVNFYDDKIALNTNKVRVYVTKR